MAQYSVPSDSSNGFYAVTISNKGYSCTCIGFRFNRKCKHGPRVLEDPKKFRRVDKDGLFTSAKIPVVRSAAVPGFVKPMLAASVEPEDIDFKRKQWNVEEKYDGHRLIVAVQEGMVKAWARSGKQRALPAHLEKTLSKFPNGLYDGELCIPHGRSYNVTETGRAHERCYVVFDILHCLDKDTTGLEYMDRRILLNEIFTKLVKTKGVQLADTFPVASWADVERHVGEIWERDGEGVIVKDRRSKYEIGTRSKSFIKVKQLKSAVLICTGFKDGKLGPCSKIQLKDKKGNTTSAKVRTFELLNRIQKNPSKYVGREVRIDYQERTPDGGYRHPRMDRFEDE